MPSTPSTSTPRKRPSYVRTDCEPRVAKALLPVRSPSSYLLPDAVALAAADDLLAPDFRQL